MAEAAQKSLPSPAVAFSSLPITRQIILLVGLALCVSSGVAVFMWFQKPSFTVLYSTLAEKDAAQVIDALSKADIKYKLDQKTGAIMVPSDQVHNARLKLAMDGLPEGGNLGFELLEKKRGFGSSPFMETARYQRAIEGELARSITALRNVQSARIHLAIPEKSVFVRDRKPPSASVLLDLYPGRVLQEGQVAAVVHLVASSIPNMVPESVTVVDQNGNLLSSNKNSEELMRAAFEFDFVRKVEQQYVRRIQDILEPIVGSGGLRAQVVADLDLSVTEQTQEIYDPDLRALRSEQTVEEKGPGGSVVSGVPGALSNQPPPAGSTEEQQRAQQKPEGQSQGRSSINQTRNYDLSRTINHTRMPVGGIKRLSVAVVVDAKQEVDGEGNVNNVPRSDQEMQRITNLVKKAVGFDENRGDSVNVVSTAFTKPPKIEPLPTPPVWEAPWLRDVMKILFGIVVAVVFFFAILRPVMRNLSNKVVVRHIPQPAGPGLENMGEQGDENNALTHAQQQMTSVKGPSEFENKLSTAKNLVVEDPKKVAKVVKSWIAEDE